MADRENELPARRQPRNSLETYQQTARHQSLMSDPEVKRQWKEYSRSVKGMERLSMKAWFDVNYPKGGKGYRKNG
jgi:hypothetical protein